ncbi:VOC family protein [Planotetraspora mira]
MPAGRETARLCGQAAGATVIHQDDLRGRPDHVVMADPEGNEFCLL